MTLLLLALAGLVLAIAAWMVAPTALVVFAVPSTFLVIRLGGGGSGNSLSVADATLLVGAICAIPLINWGRAGPLRRVLLLMCVYQVCTLFSVAFHFNRYDSQEWLHELLLVGGSLLIGQALFERGKVRVALGLYLAVATGMSVVSIALFLAHGGHAPGGLGSGLQKNLLGVLYVVAVLVAYVNPPWVGLRGRWVRPAQYVCAAGTVACGSRQAMIALVVAVIVVALRAGRASRRGRLLVIGMIPVALVAYGTIEAELKSRLPQNSVTYRTLWLNQAIGIWRQSPVFGVGERFWHGGHYGLTSQPPNAEVSMLATGGLVGLLGFLVLLLGTLWLLWRLPVAAGMLGFAVLLAHVVEGQFDIFWVTASGSIPWILVGMSLGAGAAEPVVPLPGELPPAAFGPGVPGGPVPWVAATRFGASPGPAIPSPGQPAGRPPWSRYPAPRFPMAKYPSVQPRPRRGGAPDAEG